VSRENGNLGVNEKSKKPRRDTQYDVASHYKPSLVRALSDARVSVAQAACGRNFTVFRSIHGAVFTCGSSLYGVLGVGSNSTHFSKKYPNCPYPARVDVSPFLSYICIYIYVCMCVCIV
jgi:alpha-tubulin suppressor-like RCC1 family protein